MGEHQFKDLQVIQRLAELEKRVEFVMKAFSVSRKVGTIEPRQVVTESLLQTYLNQNAPKQLVTL